MNPTELRALADALRPMAAAPCFDGINIDRAADYLHQQADQQSVGTLTISTFRGRAQNQNRDFDYTGGLPDGSYSLYTAPVPAAPKAKIHPDETAVDRFAAAMKSKLAEKRRQGKSGWDDPRCPTEHLAALLREHVAKGDPLDVGNFAMMLWCRGGSTNETQAEPKRPQTCLWSRADDDTDVWETTCGHAFTIIDGSPADNQMAFCCYCGRELESETGDSDADK